ncbi:hypothetical protein [Bradyrhizobium sp. USDA 3458]|uniref:hypothetical protein n=1 Tax=Bradyrhizobium sp. USDA 3458 TaxID=2591461 RepID=UPI0011419DE0|nr:hypothetical protein [Bradyrhizobium sp. USDA 3458]
MSEMQERVAAAMEKRRAELINQPLARIWPELAVAAIEAMREPTKEIEAEAWCDGPAPDLWIYLHDVALGQARKGAVTRNGY